MTQQFQVGDIVYVNPPSQEDLDFLDDIGLGDGIEMYVGQCAVIHTVESIDDTIAAISTCDPEYEFKLEDAETLLKHPKVTTRTTHLKLIRPSMLRGSSLQEPLSGLTFPMAGSIFEQKIIFEKDNYQRIILPGASVDEVFLRTDGIGFEFYNYDSVDDSGLSVNAYVTLEIPMQHIRSPKDIASQFTTF